MKKGIQPSGLLTRRKLLSASVKVFLEKGYERATAKEIAELAGVSTGAPFLLFGNKEGVLLELVKQMFAGQFDTAEKLAGPEADPLLLYAVETGLQLHITELSEPLRELYVTAYTLPSTADYIYEQMVARLEYIFTPYLPQLERKDFYELEVASAGVTRSFMAKPCDLYFTMERKLRRYLSCCYKLYEVPPERYRPVIEQAQAMELKSMAGLIIAQTAQAAEAGFEAVMAEGAE